MAVNDHITVAASDIGDTGRIKPVVDEQLYLPNPDQAPFLGLVSRMGVDHVPNMSHLVQEEWDPDRVITITETVTNSDTTIAVDDYTGLVEGVSLMLIASNGDPMGETLRVAATPTTATVTFATRGFGGTAIAIPSGSKLMRLGNVRSEDDTSPTPQGRATNRNTQYLGTLARSAGITDIERLINQYGVAEDVRLKAQNAREFAKDSEAYLLFSEEVVDTGTTGQTVQMTKGLRWIAAEANILSTNGTMTYDMFVQWLQDCNRLGGIGEKFLFSSGSQMAGISKWPLLHDIARQEASSDTFGFDIKTIIIPGPAGNVNLVYHPMFDVINDMLLVDMRGLKIAELEGITFNPNRAANDEYREEWEIRRIFGLKVTNRWSQGIATGVERIAA